MAAAAEVQVGNGLRRWLMPALAAAALVLAAVMISRALARTSLEDVVASVRAMPARRVALAGVFAAASYFCLTLFDTIGVRYAGRRVPYPRVALASFVALSLGHTIGFAALSSGTIRFRFYRRWGLGAGDIAAVVLSSAATVALGLATLGGLAFLLEPTRARVMLGLDARIVSALGLAALAIPALALVGAARTRRPLRIAGWRIRLPTLPLAAAQVVAGTLNFAMVAACLHQTLSAAVAVDYPTVASIFAMANLAAIVAHVPGGLGVIEGVTLLMLPGHDLIGPLLVFRFVYYLAPLVLGILLFAVSEMTVRLRGRAADDVSRAG
jgi:uncharacterized membrane protein YbhN (UPF0104 family)